MKPVGQEAANVGEKAGGSSARVEKFTMDSPP